METLIKKEIGVFDYCIERRDDVGLVLVIRDIKNGNETVLICSPVVVDSLKELLAVAEMNMKK